jgi:hypothetical protein
MSTSIKIEKPNNDELKQATIDTIKNNNRLNTLVITECGKRCLSNFRSENLSTDENVCLTSCYSKFYDSLEMGEKLFDMFSRKEVNTALMAKGKYDELVNSLKPTFNI